MLLSLQVSCIAFDTGPERARRTPFWQTLTMIVRGKQEAAPTEKQRKPADTVKRPDVSLKPKEIGGPKGPEPTRYGDWERAGRCIDF